MKKARQKGGLRQSESDARGAVVAYGYDAAPTRTSRSGVLVFGTAMFVLFFGVVAGAAYAAMGEVSVWCVFAAAIAGALAASCIRIALPWEKVVVLRFGNLARIVGPGLYFVIPIVEFGTIRIDQRVMATPYYAERTLTADLVPVNIDVVLYWMVRDAEKACTEVGDYFSAVSYLAQTAMREAVGRSDIAQVALRRDQLDSEIKEEIEREAASWGVDIIAVKVRDIVIPDELQEMMSLEAQADRESNARMSVAAVEADVAEMLKDAADIYGDPSAALRLRTMLMQYESVKHSKGTVITMPSNVSDGFVDATPRTESGE